MKKSILNKKISSVQIDAANCFRILLKTVQTNEVRVEAKMDGEYSADLELNVRENGNTLFLNAGFRPGFNIPNDKLSAHKVVSISLEIQIPEDKNISVQGTSTNVTGEGKYKKFAVRLSDGSCELKNVVGDVEIRTQSGTILVNTPSAKINAKSKYGSVDDNPIPIGNDNYILNTVTGNIVLNKTE